MQLTTDLVQVLKDLGPLISVFAVLLGTLLGGWMQARISRRRSDEERANQVKLLTETHRHNLEVMTMQQRREEDLRISQFEESDKADRLVVIEYIDLMLPRLIEVASINYIASDNKDLDELQRFTNLRRYMTVTLVDPSHPERNLDLRMAFLLFQLTAAMRIALNARWMRPLTDDQVVFLEHWESHIEPMICSGRYPGKELLYREQVEIITQEMLTAPDVSKVPRPLNWKEFCEKYSADPVLQELAEQVAGRIRFIFDEANALPPRKAMQCRLGIMALYLIQLSKEARGSDSWTWREDGLWEVVVGWYKWEQEQSQNPRWYVFERGDVAKRIPSAGRVVTG